MRGKVAGVNRQNGMAAISTVYGYTVAQVLEGDLSVGDDVSGELDDHGDVVLVNHSSGLRVQAYVEAIHASPRIAQQLISGQR